VDTSQFSTQGLTVLIVEDDLDLGQVLKTALEERLQLRTLVATDGLEAVAMTKQEHPSLILMDLNMPYVSGFEAIRRIKDDPVISDTPIVAFSNHDWDFHWKQKALALGCVSCSNKLITLDELDALVLNFIDRSPTTRALSAPTGTADSSTSLTYYWDDWGRIVDYLHSVDFDVDAANAADSPYAVAHMIERNSDLWDDPDSPQTIWMEPWQKEVVLRFATQLKIQQASL
jgi:CheY-like chemotaxis protein